MSHSGMPISITVVSCGDNAYTDVIFSDTLLFSCALY